MPWLMVAAFGARTPIAQFMPQLRETAMEARFPSPNSDRGRGKRRWKRAFSPSTPLPKKKVPGWRGATLKALVPAAGTMP